MTEARPVGRPPLCPPELADRILDLRDNQQLSLRQIAAVLNRDQICPPGGGKCWRHSHVDRLLHTAHLMARRQARTAQPTLTSPAEIAAPGTTACPPLSGHALAASRLRRYRAKHSSQMVLTVRNPAARRLPDRERPFRAPHGQLLTATTPDTATGANGSGQRGELAPGAVAAAGGTGTAQLGGRSGRPEQPHRQIGLR